MPPTPAFFPAMIVFLSTDGQGIVLLAQLRLNAFQESIGFREKRFIPTEGHPQAKETDHIA